VPIFDVDKENYDHWEIQWKAFAQVENLVSAIGKELELYMPASVAAYNKTEKAGTTDKGAESGSQCKHASNNISALALNPMELFHLVS